MKGRILKVKWYLHFFATRFRLRTALAFTLILGSLVAPPAFGLQIVRLCNQGSVHIAVAWAQETRALLGMGQLWESEGWYWVSPDECSNVWVSSLDHNTVLNLVFAVRTPQYTFGVINLPLNVRDIPNRQKSICVLGDPHHRGSMGSSPAPPCSSPYREVPTSSALWLSGNLDWKLTVKPSAADFERLAVVLEGPTGSPQSKSPPTTPAPTQYELPRSPGFLETLVSSYAKVERDRAKVEKDRASLSRSCAQTGKAWRPEERERYCTCMVAAALDSFNDNTISALSKEWNQTNLYQLYSFKSPSKCPPMPEANPEAPIAKDLADVLWANYGLAITIERRELLGKLVTFCKVARLAQNSPPLNAGIQINDTLGLIDDVNIEDEYALFQALNQTLSKDKENVIWMISRHPPPKPDEVIRLPVIMSITVPVYRFRN